MKTFNFFFTMIFMFVNELACPQSVSIRIGQYRDTLWTNSCADVEEIYIYVTNNSDDTVYLPRFRLARPDVPYSSFPQDRWDLKYNESLKNRIVDGVKMDKETCLFKTFGFGLGDLILFVMNSENDSIVKPRCSISYHNFAEARAGWDTNDLLNPYHFYPAELFSFQRMLMIPPKTTITHRLEYDYRDLDLEVGKSYRVFLIYVFDRDYFHKNNLFGPLTNKFNFPESPIKSNEMPLIRGYCTKLNIRYYDCEGWNDE